MSSERRARAAAHPTDSERLDHAVSRVVAAQNCSGCGGCVAVDPGLAMERDHAGFNRPVRLRSGTTVPGAVDTFTSICPGVQVSSPRPAGAEVHPTLGPVLASWEAWATDPEIRHRGSSGGALTALVAWLTQSGQASRFVGARSNPTRPQTTVSVALVSRNDALAAAGSRYGPVSALAEPGALGPGEGLVGKPCEVSAARALLDRRPSEPGRDDRAQGDDPILLSFFCAGTPSQRATDTFIEGLGLPAGTELEQMWYRGRGWPGRFTAVATDGGTVSASYDESWGQALGTDLQWRCKICPDGVGESSDISAADFWHTDERGYPDFTEGDGCSALLARTPRGHALVLRALAEGVIEGRPITVDQLAAVQPLQVSRRQTLLGRLVGTRLAGRPVPRFHGFGLTRLAAANPRASLRTGRGSFRRVRAARRETP